jgi:1-deoxy-D-xylulose-5-phosphate synthase
LPALAADIRSFLVENVVRAGGHLGPNLGVVELSIVLHRVFVSPHDVIIFDTGHQAYVHKMLTGRTGEFARLRQEDGLSGYPSRQESEHDFMENSHASTALSYADGLAKAFALGTRPDRRVVAVVGDGAMTGGMSWEALNNIAAAPDRPVVIVLNDNGRSYEPTTGALANHLAHLRLRESAPPLRSDNVFESLGLAYLGPVDGHDLGALEEHLRKAAAMSRPVVVHCVTRKGKGYAPAEEDKADCLHAVGPAAPEGAVTAKDPSWTDVFGAEMLEMGDQYNEVVCLTGAMMRPTGLHAFACRYPDRAFDVGIAEQHAVTSAAGLALGGMHPVVAVYSTFLTRALDQVLMDVALHHLPVTFILDRAGVTGPDGASHHGMWDTSLLAMVPGLRMAEPRDATRLRELLRECVNTADGPTALRYPKGAAGAELPTVEHVRGVDLLRTSTNPTVLLVAAGSRAHASVHAAELLAAEGITATVADPRWLFPLAPGLVGLAAGHELVVTVEDAVITGGLGQRVVYELSQADLNIRVRCLALPSRFLPGGSRGDILERHRLDASGIATTVMQALRQPGRL